MIPQLYCDKVKAYFNDDKKAWDWWKEANSAFGMFSPLAMLKLGREKKVIEFINKRFGDE
jgi:hypothetical protein